MDGGQSCQQRSAGGKRRDYHAITQGNAEFTRAEGNRQRNQRENRHHQTELAEIFTDHPQANGVTEFNGLVAHEYRGCEGTIVLKCW